MTPAAELRALRAIVILIAAVPLTAGTMAAFGGLDGLALYFARPAPVEVDANLRNHLRAICGCFAGFGALAVWSVYALEERKAAFRIVVVFAAIAGCGRVTGWIVEGYPGVVAIAIMVVELAVIPLLLLWHTRLVRLGGTATA